MKFPKVKSKKHNRKTAHDFSKEVKRKEYEDAKGTCRICQSRPITQYHHANEKGMGGGRGLGIQINCIGLCDTCHNHDNTEMLRETKEILRDRINKMLPNYNGSTHYPVKDIAEALQVNEDYILRQMIKGFLKASVNNEAWGMSANKEDISRWLGVA